MKIEDVFFVGVDAKGICRGSNHLHRLLVFEKLLRLVANLRVRTTTIEHFICSLNCGIGSIRDVKSLMTSKRPQKSELAVEQPE